MSANGVIIGLWMDNEAEEAAKFYVEVFKDSELGVIRRYNTDTPSHKPIGSVITVDFTINGQRFQALNGGPDFKPNEAISLIIECADQAEVDYYYQKLSADPESEICGWLKDKYGFSWQIVPDGLEELLYQDDQEKGKRVMEKLLNMKQLDIAELEKAGR